MKNNIIKSIIAAFMLIQSAQAQVQVQWNRTLQFDGQWEGLATLNLEGQIFQVTYHLDFKSIIDGNAMTMDENFSDANLGDFKGANMIGYDPYSNTIHWFSVDNFGTAHEHTGTWVNPKHFRMEHQSIRDGKIFHELISFKLKSNNTRMDVKLIATFDHQVVEVITGTLYKQGSRMTGPDNFNDLSSAIKIYPNPTDGDVFIESDEAINEVRVFNEAGQLMYQANPHENDLYYKLDKPGIYIIELQINGRTETKKVIMN